MIELSYLKFLLLVVRNCLWYQGQGHLPRSRSNTKVTLKKENDLLQAVVLHEYISLRQMCPFCL